MRATVSVCPSALVEAPVERVWQLLASPKAFDTWVNLTLVSADPEGPTRAGQRLVFAGPTFARWLRVTIDVLEVDAERWRLHLLVHVPLGLVNDETITMSEAGEGRTLVRFG